MVIIVWYENAVNVQSVWKGVMKRVMQVKCQKVAFKTLDGVGY